PRISSPVKPPPARSRVRASSYSNASGTATATSNAPVPTRDRTRNDAPRRVKNAVTSTVLSSTTFGIGQWYYLRYRCVNLLMYALPGPTAGFFCSRGREGSHEPVVYARRRGGSKPCHGSSYRPCRRPITASLPRGRSAGASLSAEHGR